METTSFLSCDRRLQVLNYTTSTVGVSTSNFKDRPLSRLPISTHGIYIVVA